MPVTQQLPASSPMLSGAPTQQASVEGSLAETHGVNASSMSAQSWRMVAPPGLQQGEVVPQVSAQMTYAPGSMRAVGQMASQTHQQQVGGGLPRGDGHPPASQAYSFSAGAQQQ